MRRRISAMVSCIFCCSTRCALIKLLRAESATCSISSCSISSVGSSIDVNRYSFIVMAKIVLYVSAGIGKQKRRNRQTNREGFAGVGCQGARVRNVLRVACCVLRACVVFIRVNPSFLSSPRLVLGNLMMERTYEEEHTLPLYNRPFTFVIPNLIWNLILSRGYCH